MESLFVLLFMLVFLIVPFAIVDGMARRRNRSRLGWFVVGLMLTPLASFVLLLCLGYAEDLPPRHKKREHD